MPPPPVLTPDDDDASSSDVQHDSPSHFSGLTERLLKRMALTSGLVARSHARQQLELTVHKIASLRSAAALLHEDEAKEMHHCLHQLLMHDSPELEAALELLVETHNLPAAASGHLNVLPSEPHAPLLDSLRALVAIEPSATAAICSLALQHARLDREAAAHAERLHFAEPPVAPASPRRARRSLRPHPFSPSGRRRCGGAEGGCGPRRAPQGYLARGSSNQALLRRSVGTPVALGLRSLASATPAALAQQPHLVLGHRGRVLVC